MSANDDIMETVGKAMFIHRWVQYVYLKKNMPWLVEIGIPEDRDEHRRTMGLKGAIKQWRAVIKVAELNIKELEIHLK